MGRWTNVIKKSTFSEVDFFVGNEVKMSEYIKVCEVEKYYGEGSNVTKAVDGVSFDVDKGEFVGIMGASGSGKSTLLNMMSTIDKVTAGHIYYGETDITGLNEDKLSDFRRDNLGFVFQDFNLLDTLTIGENVALAMTFHTKRKKEIKEKVDEMLNLLGISGIRDKFPYQVSGGQKQRCACARALINNPSLLLADEPTGALDSKASIDIMNELEELNNRGQTIILITHDINVAKRAKRMVRIADGKLYEEVK